jgi:hypothetical protein
MSDLPTIKVKRDGPRGWRIINQAAFDPKVHKAWDEGEAIAEALAKPDPIPDASDAHKAVIAKISPPDLDGDGKPGGSKPAPEPVGAPIPENWRDLHWTQRVKLAKELGADDDIDAAAAAEFIAAKEG